MAAFAVMSVLCVLRAAWAQKPSENPHHGFSDAAHWAKIFESPERAKWQKPDEVVRALKLRPGQVVIDIGAGTGYFTRRFAQAVAPSGKAVGLDIEPDMVAYMQADAKKLGVKNYDARVVKPDDPELAPGSADLVFFCDTLHHMDNRVAYFRKLAVALRPGGRVAVIDFKKKGVPFRTSAGDEAFARAGDGRDNAPMRMVSRFGKPVGSSRESVVAGEGFEPSTTASS